jgi:ribonucleoside-diphosphate reductase beta chain
LLLLKESSSQELLFHLLVKETWSDARFNILNELISRDEGVHCDFAVHLHNHHLINKVPKDRIKALVDALNIERIYYRISSSKFDRYECCLDDTEFVADRLLVELGCDREYNTTNPFDFMDMISLQGKQISSKRSS